MMHPLNTGPSGDGRPEAGPASGRIARAGLAVSVAAVGAAYAGVLVAGPTPSWSPIAMIAGVAGSAAALMVMGASRRGRVGRIAAPIGFVFAVLLVGFGAALFMSPAEGTSPELWLGLPPRAGIVLYGVGLLTLLVVPAAYALTFDELGLTGEDWRRVRRRAAAARGEGDEPGRAPDGDRGGRRPGGSGARAGGDAGPEPPGTDGSA